PTTYIKSGYSGYDPYTPGATTSSEGQFYDNVLKKPCTYGTSYSDEAAIRARKKAAAIKASGITIFSIGVDVAGQTIQKYVTQSEGASGYSVVDRTGTSYEIGDASSTEAYKNWLRNSIGSGYYYDSTDSSGLEAAYRSIFETIKELNQAGAVADWVATDHLPLVNNVGNVEFIGFYNKDAQLVQGDLTGTYAEGGENTASFITKDNAISWNLKQSGYTTASSGSTITYTFQLVYRVRLMNENSGFVEGQPYVTNGTTTLTYRTVEGSDGNLTVSDPKTVDFPVPAVKGYLGELQFTKRDQLGRLLAGAEFTLTHDTAACGACRGDGQTSVKVPVMTVWSDSDGKVSFSGIPSGHQYTLTETKAPTGALPSGTVYHVTVAYDKVTVTPDIQGGVVNQLTTLSISKQVTGSSELQQDTFGFTLTLTPPAGTTLQSSYSAQSFTWENGGWVADGELGSVSVTGSTITFRLKHHQQLTIYGLPVGTSWAIAEDAPGYKVTCKVDGKSVSGSQSSGVLQGSTDVAYTNQSMAKLPETGGPGTQPYTWAGIMLCMLSALLYKLLKRRRGDEHLT
ncbi:MAG: SpaA isopeptide-forming pilin-related protein, partial [Aristaeellaceae bacterium]